MDYGLPHYRNLLDAAYSSRVANVLARASGSGEKWIGKVAWFKLAKGIFRNINAQSVQQTIADFCDAVTSTVMLHRNGHPETNYPIRKPKYRCVIFTNQATKIHSCILPLHCNKAGVLRIEIPSDVSLIGRLMEVRLHFGKVQLVCEVPDIIHPTGSTIGVDLGVNTLVAATDGNKAILVSGRAVKSAVRLRNKTLAEIQSKQSRQTKHSRLHKRLQRLKYKMLDQSKRRIRDLCHKATRKVADAFPHATVFVGEPFNDAAKKLRRVQAQQVSQSCGAILIAMLAYKLASATRINEAYSSQTCPVCGERNKCRRIYKCQSCGCTAPRDVVGAVNIRSIGIDGAMIPGRSVPNTVRFVHPHKYAVPKAASPPDTRQVARENREAKS